MHTMPVLLGQTYCLAYLLFSAFFLFLALKVSLSVPGKTPKSGRSLYVQHKCTRDVSRPEVHASCWHNMCDAFTQWCGRSATPDRRLFRWMGRVD